MLKERNEIEDIRLRFQCKIENAESLRKIIRIMPYDSRKRWRSKADTISENEDYIKLDDKVQFVQKDVPILTHPVFGDISDEIKEPSEQTFTVQFATPSSESQRSISCINCKQNLEIKECP